VDRRPRHHVLAVGPQLGGEEHEQLLPREPFDDAVRRRHVTAEGGVVEAGDPRTPFGVVDDVLERPAFDPSETK
jgi:hypothetical protein